MFFSVFASVILPFSSTLSSQCKRFFLTLSDAFPCGGAYRKHIPSTTGKRGKICIFFKITGYTFWPVYPGRLTFYKNPKTCFAEAIEGITNK